jgi:hypothetical protein
VPLRVHQTRKAGRWPWHGYFAPCLRTNPRLLASHLRSKEAKLEAANNLTEARLRIERHTGALIPRLQERGCLLKPSETAVVANDSLVRSLTDYAIR